MSVSCNFILWYELNKHLQDSLLCFPIPGHADRNSTWRLLICKICLTLTWLNRAESYRDYLQNRPHVVLHNHPSLSARRHRKVCSSKQPLWRAAGDSHVAHTWSRVWAGFSSTLPSPLRYFFSPLPTTIGQARVNMMTSLEKRIISQIFRSVAITNIIVLPLSEPETGLEEGEAQVQMGRMMTFMQVS